MDNREGNKLAWGIRRRSRCRKGDASLILIASCRGRLFAAVNPNQTFIVIAESYVIEIEIFGFCVVLIGVYFGGAASLLLLRRWQRAYKAARQKPNHYGPWSIGIYEGDTPFEISEPRETSNPILSARDVKDKDIRFVADPFMIRTNGQFHLFFEAMERKSNRGAIGLAESDDGKNWKYKGVVMEENFHLSYPYVFAENGDYYMIPESAEDLSVRLYKASQFPDKWEHVGNLLSGYRYLDASVFRQQGKWWMFVATGSSNVLNLYFSDELERGWRPHPMNPVVKG